MFKDRIVSGLLGSMLLVVFQPFGLNSFGSMRWLLLAGLCLCVFLIIIGLECIITWVLRMPHDPSRGMKYLVRRNIIFQGLNILSQTLVTALYIDRFCCIPGELDNHLSWRSLGYCFLLFVCCSVIIGLYWRNVYMKREFQHRLEEAQYLNGILEERQRRYGLAQQTQPAAEEEGQHSEPVCLSGSTRESLTLAPSDFVYAEAEGNYVQIYYLSEGVLKQSQLRSSISQVESTLQADARIMRCHRAFVVNLAHVSKVEGQGHTLQLYMGVIRHPIPVSKTYLQSIKERIVNPA